MAKRIHKNVWDNWNGYEGSKRVKEFGCDEQAAKEWLTALPAQVTRNGYISSQCNEIQRDVTVLIVPTTSERTSRWTSTEPATVAETTLARKKASNE